MKQLTNASIKVKDGSGNWNIVPGIAGESAYEIAVRRGQFTGTEAEWLNALETERAAAVASIEDAGETTLASIPSDYTTLSNTVSQQSTEITDLNTAFNAGMFDDYNLFDTSTFGGNNTVVTNNGDGTFTVGTGDYGRSYFGEAVNLKAGVYYLYGVSNGYSYLSTDGSYQSAIALNENANPKAIVIEEAVTAYLCFRVPQIPSISFVIRPFLYGTKIGAIHDGIEECYDNVESFSNGVSALSTAISNLGLSVVDGEISITFEEA